MDTCCRSRRSDLAARYGAADFQPGEEVVAFGEWRDPTTFVASRVEPLLYPLRGKVTERHGTDVLTERGELDLGSARPYVDPDTLDPGSDFALVSPGANVDALVLRDTDTHRSIAFEVALRPRP